MVRALMDRILKFSRAPGAGGLGPSAMLGRRHEDRVPGLRPCAYVVSEILDDGSLHIREGHGWIHNRSTGGMLVELEGPLEFPRMLEVHLEENGWSSLWVLEVRWSQRLPTETNQSRWFVAGRLLFVRAA